MFQVLTFIIGLVIGGVVMWLGLSLQKREKRKSLIERQAEEKRWDKEAILGLMESGNQPLTNSNLKMMLDIPESTATRYLEELEKEGKIRQVGLTGRSVYYEKVK